MCECACECVWVLLGKWVWECGCVQMTELLVIHFFALPLTWAPYFRLHCGPQRTSALSLLKWIRGEGSWQRQPLHRQPLRCSADSRGLLCPSLLHEDFLAGSSAPFSSLPCCCSSVLLVPLSQFRGNAPPPPTPPLNLSSLSHLPRSLLRLTIVSLLLPSNLPQRSAGNDM